MKKLLLIVALSVLVFSSFAQQQLFNRTNLKGWDIFIGTAVKGFDDLKEKATPESTYSIVEMDGQKVIRISGEVNASLATKKAYKNYHLRLEYKWGDKVYNTRNSGLLYHSIGSFGAAFGTWMTNIECQLKHDQLGDTYLMNNTYCETTVKKNEAGNGFIFSKTGTLEKFGEGFPARMITKADDAEKPLGEWNIIDLYCVGRTALHVVNGNVMMINTNCGIIMDGQVKPLSKGKIQIQSEGGEMYVRKIEIVPIREIPVWLLK